MRIASLTLDQFRCIEHCDLPLNPDINCIVGDNASGKTSLLEAVYLLGRGQSFRQSKLPPLIRRGHPAATVRAHVAEDSGHARRLAALIKTGESRFKLDNNLNTRRFDLINALPLQHIDPNVHRLLEQGPKYRRRYLDWGVFHVEHAFFPAWRRFRRALKQRNRAIRANAPKHQVVAWDAELVEQGEIIDACRRRYLSEIERCYPRIIRQLTGDNPLEFIYRSGWRGTSGYGAALAYGLDADLRAGFTQQGPHRADLRLTIADTRAQDWISRGQQKLISAALLLTQAEIMHASRGVRPIIMFDDMVAELGHAYQKALAETLTRVSAQSIVTFLDAASIPERLRDTSSVFHVEHGTIRRPEPSGTC